MLAVEILTRLFILYYYIILTRFTQISRILNHNAYNV